MNETQKFVLVLISSLIMFVPCFFIIFLLDVLTLFRFELICKYIEIWDNLLELL